MEPMEVVPEGEWSSLSGTYTTEEAQFLAQLLGNAPPSTESGFSSWSGSWPTCESVVSPHSLSDEHSSFYHSNSFSYMGVVFPLSSGHGIENLYLRDETNLTPEAGSGSILIDSDLTDVQDSLILDMAAKNLVRLEDDDREVDVIKTSSLESSRKRSRSTGNVQKMKRNNVKLRKSQSLEFSSQDGENDSANNDNHEENARVYKQSSSSCCSEDDSSISRGQNGGSGSSTKGAMALNLGGKTRASRGSATDPQSLYARKRRERINERLKILQRLVPNGTKVDISTMLEEAVHYVKFLQLQIKLLSSDDLWMYAPIAYNGMDIGLDLKINTPR